MSWTARRRNQEAALVASCEAYWEGSSRARFEAAGKPVPMWAWVNVLAHGDLPALEATATAGGERGTPEAVVADLARRARVLVRWGVSGLPVLQRETLLPLEFALARRYGGGSPGSAEELAEAIRGVGIGSRPPGWFVP